MEYPNRLSSFNELTLSVDPDVAAAGITGRLENLLEINQTSRESAAARISPLIQSEILSMRLPLAAERAYSFLGMMLGSLPPATMFLAFLSSSNYVSPAVVLLIFLSVIASSAAGFVTGKHVGEWAMSLEHTFFIKRLFQLLLVGAVWGAVAGAAGGVFLFIIGGIFGSAIGAAVGAVAVPVFSIPFYLVKSGRMIDARHFTPLAFGVVFAICALFLGIAVR